MGIKLENRKLYLDILKFIAIFIVFVYHIVMDNFVVHNMYNLSGLFSLIDRVNVHMAMFACSLFIMISGATLKISQDKNNLNFIEFMKKRGLRILIPFYISYFICYIVKCFNVGRLNPFYGQPIPRWRFIFTLIGMDEYISANGIATYTLGIGEWFLGCIILCYLFFIILYRLNEKYNILTFVVLSLYYVYVCFNYDKLGFRIASHMNFVCQVYNFYLGMLLISIKSLDKYKKLLMPISIFLIALICFCPIPFRIPMNITVTIMTLSAFVLFNYLNDWFMNSDGLVRFINIVSKYSYEFFLVHHFVIYQVNYMLNYRQINTLGMILVILVDLVIICILSYVVKRISNTIYKLIR